MTNGHVAGAAGTQVSDDELVTIESAVLGALAVPAANVFELPAGLIGFERYTRYALIPSGRDGLFWLQSAEEPTLAFVLADPFQVAAGYHAELADADVAAIGAARAEDVLLLVVVTLGGAAGATPTANLRAPLAFSVVARRGRQVVLVDDRYGTAEPVSL